ncbi:alpha/beta hydrolase [Nocardioides sp. URHA0032]|uniref:alpha/beta hydrolase n=1 Tax=Nocardioides sp. URHA0032 TaxID=1380388 RepID=UPI00048E329D|nr:alpha/beta hydrolase-fold protein [Nocardioides sp. URHA0032]
MTGLTRRGFLVGGGAAVAGAAALGGAAAGSGRVRRALGLRPDFYVPDAPEGRVGLEPVASAAMGGDVDLFTAVPAGYGDGAGLPVVVVLHGSSASAADFRGFGFGSFLTAAVQQGAPPFVLAGTDDGPSGWVPAPGADPVAMLRDELPGWLADRGFDADRRALWGWSRGGYGALRFALEEPDWARAAALFSPAVSAADPALAELSPLAGLPLAVWCGTDDAFYDDVRDVVGRLPEEPEAVTYADGGHTRVFWNDHTVDAFGWLGGELAGR